MSEQVILVIPYAWVGVILGVVLPFVVGLLNHFNAPKSVKAVVGIIVAGVAAVLTQLAGSGTDVVITWGTVRLFALTYGVQLLAYLGLWSNIPSNGGINAKLAPNKGIGAPKAA